MFNVICVAEQTGGRYRVLDIERVAIFRSGGHLMGEINSGPADGSPVVLTINHTATLFREDGTLAVYYGVRPKLEAAI